MHIATNKKGTLSTHSYKWTGKGEKNVWKVQRFSKHLLKKLFAHNTKEE